MCHCLCSCGNTKWLFKYNVLNGHTKSCGHLLKKDNFKRIDGVVLATLHKKTAIRDLKRLFIDSPKILMRKFFIPYCLK